MSVRTNGFTLLTLFVRLSALIALVNGILKIIPLATNHIGNDSSLLTQDVYYLVFVLVLFALLWFFADLLAKFALARKDAELFESSMPATEWAKLLFGGLGVWHASWAVIDLAYYVPYFFTIGEIKEYDPNWIQNDFIPGIVSTFIRLVIGLALFFGSSGLTRLFQQYRHYGVSSTPDTAETPAEPDKS